MMRFPSGDQPFTLSEPGWKVSRFGSPPDDDTTQTSVLPPTVRLKAMRDPSGEKTGSVSISGEAVRRRASPPFRDTTHKSPPYSKAIASRETAG